MSAVRRRLDLEVVARGLAPSRERARALILAGRIRVDGRLRDKPGATVAPGSRVELVPGRRPYASRGGEKLAPVLEPLGVRPAGLDCLDVGASTGGFTDVLLRAGARSVTCVDVGRGLLDERLRRDPRVRVLEGINARHLTPELVSPPYGLVTADLSFISLTLVLPAILPLAPEGQIVCLVKPQFELSRREVGRGGVVRDLEGRRRAVLRVGRHLEAAGWHVTGVKPSPLPGPKGNREVFLAARPGPPGAGIPELAVLVEQEVRDEP
ncbi:MAG: TlyA family RNA methyltransferase [Acidobacteria bacterium]|nr:MAG: TlyA family RNA methyltransferase [Acidobacteriota bacterium]